MFIDKEILDENNSLVRFITLATTLMEMLVKETKYVAKNHLIAYTTKGSINLNFIVLK